jgi:excisionase family DNA binding protein
MRKQAKRKPRQLDRKPEISAAETTSVEAAARRLRIGRNQAYEAARRGEIPTIRIGKRLLVVTAALDRMLRGEAANTTTK